MKNNTRHIEILQVAAELFFKHSYAQTKMIDIANQAGLSKGLLYFYYKNKEDLFIAVLDQALEINLSFIQSTIEQLEGSNGFKKSISILDNFLELSIQTSFFQEIIIQTMQLTSGDGTRDLAKKLGLSEKIFDHNKLPDIRQKQYLIFDLVRQTIESGQKDKSIMNLAPSSAIYLSIWSFIIGFDTMLPIMERHKKSKMLPKHEYLLTDFRVWKKMILRTAEGVLLTKIDQLDFSIE